MTRAAGRAIAALLVAAAAACSSLQWLPWGRGNGGDSARAKPGQSEEVSVRHPMTTAPVPTAGSLPHRTLPCGLTVVVREDHSLPIVATAIAYRVGSGLEPAGLTGASHFLEHMLFKGTPSHGKGEIDRFTFLAGGTNNAFTAEDVTVYHFAVSSDRWREVLAIEAERMRAALLDPREFDAERVVVLQELNRALDGPWARLLQESERRLFPAGHPYHHPVIGWREDLERMTRDAVYRYYQQWYRPDRAILAVVGDVDAGDVFEFAARVFAAVEEPAPAVAAPEALAPPAETEFRIETEHQLSRLVVSHRGAPWTSEDSLALDVVAKILGEGRRSRLYQRLVERERLTREGGFSVWHDARAHAGVFHVVVELNPGADARRAAAAVVEEVERLGREPVSAEELARAQNLIVAAHVYQSEERITVAQEIARGWAMGTPDYWEKYPERIRGVTAGQVRAACAAYLHARARVIGIARGTAAGRAQPAMPGAKPCRTGGGRAGQPLQVPQDEAVRIPEIGEVQTVVFPNGLTLIIHPRRDLPIVAVRAYVEAGAAYDPEGKSGLSNLTGRMLDQGTYDPTTGRTRTHEEIAAWIEGVGGRLETDATSVLLQVLKPWESEGYDLLCDLLRHPSFPPDRLERVRDDVLAEIEGRDDHPAQFCRRLLREVVFQGHPLARPSEGLTAAQVRSITREDVVAHHERHYRPDRTIVAVVGDVTPLMVVEEIRRRLGVDWLPAREPLPAVPDVGRQGERRLLCVTRHTEQVNAALGHVGIPRSDPDFEAVRMMEYILYKGSGFTDRLSARVRDEAGLAYEVWGDMTGSADRWPGMLTIYVGTEARDKDRALGLIRETLVEFLRSGPRPEEMEAARSYLLRSFVFRWETNLDRAQYLIAVYRFGLGMDYHRRFHDAIRRMTAQDVLRAAQRVLRPDDLTVVLVGPVDARGNLIEEQR